jgi:soluble lytic murein transglycosylase-like protein
MRFAFVLLITCSFDAQAQATKSPASKNPVVESVEIPIEQGNRVRVETREEIKSTSNANLAGLPFHSVVARHAARYRLDPAFVHAVILVESNHNPNALSPKGALGLMQLMPETASRYGVRDRSDPIDNVRGGTAYLRDLVDMFKGDLALAVAAYNAGEKAVMQYGNQIPPYIETMFYVPRVLDEYRKLKGLKNVLPEGSRITQTRDGRVSVTLPPRNSAK